MDRRLFLRRAGLITLGLVMVDPVEKYVRRFWPGWTAPASPADIGRMMDRLTRQLTMKHLALVKQPGPIYATHEIVRGAFGDIAIVEDRRVPPDTFYIMRKPS